MQEQFARLSQHPYAALYLARMLAHTVKVIHHHSSHKCRQEIASPQWSSSPPRTPQVLRPCTRESITSSRVFRDLRCGGLTRRRSLLQWEVGRQLGLIPACFDDYVPILSYFYTLCRANQICRISDQRNRHTIGT